MRRSFVALAAGVASVSSVIATALPTTASAAVPSTSKDYALIARDIIPSGQYEDVPATQPRDEQQAQMYNALTPLFNHVTASDINQDFKPEPVGSALSGPTTAETVPHAGVTVLRDSYHVPHIYGATRDDVTWGAGWVIAEDRGLLLAQARYDSLVAAIDAPGVSALGLIANLQSFTPSAQTEREVAKQTNSLMSAGAKGRAVLHDIDVYLQGINAYLVAHGGAGNFTRTDIYAFNALKDQFVGEGGGDEAVRSEFLGALDRKFGRVRGLKIWNDLRDAYDPEAPASVPGHVQLQPRPQSTSGNVILDPNSLSPAADRALTVARDARGHASNALLVSARRSATHHPIMVAGPQIGYYYPGLTLEMDLEGPGISQVGAMSAPFPGYIFIGRSQDSAWSLTSAGLDQIDTYVETLCGHSTHKYLFKGTCRAMTFFNAGVLGSGASAKPLTFYKTIHGSVMGYAHVHGRLVALSEKRASYGQDVRDLLFYHDLAHGQVHNIRQFFRAASQTPQTFNSFYADDKSIGVFTSGLIPIRPKNVDPAMPIDGRGKDEWKGWVSFKNHPQGINPPNGEIVNWNNRTRTRLRGPGRQLESRAMQRVDLLLNNLGHGRQRHPRAHGLGDERRRDPGRARDDVRAGPLEGACTAARRRTRATRRCSRSSMPGTRTAAAVWTAPGTARSPTRARRSWTQRGRDSPRNGSPRCSDCARSSRRSSRRSSASTTCRPRDRNSGWHVDHGQGPAHAARRAGQGQVPDSATAAPATSSAAGRSCGTRSTRPAPPWRPSRAATPARGAATPRVSRSRSSRVCSSTRCATRTGRAASSRC